MSIPAKKYKGNILRHCAHLSESQNSQSQLLERLHGVQRRGGVPLQNLHLVSVPHQRAADQFIQQRLLGQVYFVHVFSPAPILAPLRRHYVACTGGKKQSVPQKKKRE